MRTVHVIGPDKTPGPVNVVGESITILAGGDPGKPFEMHIQEGVRAAAHPRIFIPGTRLFM